MAEPLVRAHRLCRRFRVRERGRFWAERRYVQAVENVDLTISAGETVGLVGETGSGKSTLGRLLLRLLDPSSGSILFKGEDVASLRGRALKRFRRRIQLVFQNPYSSLNPRKTVLQSVSLPLRAHGEGTAATQAERVHELLGLVGLDPLLAGRHPHQLSGGQRQRVVIARALALHPEFLVLDEPVSALDVSVQAQILRLLKSLQDRLNLAYLFISHDINVVATIADRIAVMYEGRIVESGNALDILGNPSHEYTRLLLSARLSIPGAPRPESPARVVRQEGS